MKEGRGGAESERVDLAMNEVLAAERDARATVDACREEARRLVDKAELRARGISRRAEDRVRIAHRIADRMVENALQECMQKGAGNGSEQTDEAQAARLARAVDRLLDEIVGGSP